MVQHGAEDSLLIQDHVYVCTGPGQELSNYVAVQIMGIHRIGIEGTWRHGGELLWRGQRRIADCSTGMTSRGPWFCCISVCTTLGVTMHDEWSALVAHRTVPSRAFPSVLLGYVLH